MSVASAKEREMPKPYLGTRSRKFGNIAQRALIQLRHIDAAHVLDDLLVSPGKVT